MLINVDNLNGDNNKDNDDDIINVALVVGDHDDVVVINDVVDNDDDDDNEVEDDDDDDNNNNDDDIDDDDSIIQTGTHHIAYFLVHSRANSLYFSRSVLYILAISGTSGSSGFGSQSREQIDNRTVIKKTQKVLININE